MNHKQKTHCIQDTIEFNRQLLSFIDFFTAQVLKVSRTPGPTACSKTKMLQLGKVCLKS